MPLTGEYEPSKSQRSRGQVDFYEGSGGTEGTTLRGKPVVIVTTIGAKSGKIRKIPLMRVEHAGEYAVVASREGRPSTPSGITTSSRTRRSSFRTAPRSGTWSLAR